MDIRETIYIFILIDKQIKILWTDKLMMVVVNKMAMTVAYIRVKCRILFDIHVLPVSWNDDVSLPFIFQIGFDSFKNDMHGKRHSGMHINGML